MKTILVLSDVSIMKPVAHTLLKTFSLIETSTAEQSLRCFIEHDRRVDLLLADVTLNTSSGIQVALILRSEIPDLPVILTSAFPVGRWNDRDSADLQRLGWRSLAILQEPFADKLLSSTVLELIQPAQAGTVETAS